MKGKDYRPLETLKKKNASLEKQIEALESENRLLRGESGELMATTKASTIELFEQYELSDLEERLKKASLKEISTLLLSIVLHLRNMEGVTIPYEEFTNKIDVIKNRLIALRAEGVNIIEMDRTFLLEISKFEKYKLRMANDLRFSKVKYIVLMTKELDGLLYKDGLMQLFKYQKKLTGNPLSQYIISAFMALYFLLTLRFMRHPLVIFGNLLFMSSMSGMIFLLKLQYKRKKFIEEMGAKNTQGFFGKKSKKHLEYKD